MLPTALEYPSGDWNGFHVYRPARGGRSYEHFGGYKIINQITLWYLSILLLLCNQIGCFALSVGGALPTALRHARVTVLSKEDCRARWGNSIQDYHICVFDVARRTRGSCNGDSGGPLNCRSGSSWKVAGVTSWGYRGCLTSYPSVYARTSYFKDWIRTQTNGEHVC